MTSVSAFLIPEQVTTNHQ